MRNLPDLLPRMLEQTGQKNVCLVFHSADLDGHCSGAILSLHLEKIAETHLIGIDYGQNIHDKLSFVDNKKDWALVIADWSPPEISDMLRLNEDFGLFVWIDHHATAIAKFESIEKQILGLRTQGTNKPAACYLCWEACSDKQAPLALELLSAYDCWDKESEYGWEAAIMPFQVAMKAEQTIPSVNENIRLWKHLLFTPTSSAVLELIKNGCAINRYVNQQNQILADLLCFNAPFQGYRALYLNRGPGNSQMFKHRMNDDVDIMVSFVLLPKDGEYKWRVSLYTEKPDVDVSALAEKFGGGGHKQAAGFISNIMPHLL